MLATPEARALLRSSCGRLRTVGMLQAPRRHFTPPTLAGTTEEDVVSARKYCSNLLRRFDAPSYTLQTFVPPVARDAYLALRAFNIEVARVADATSNQAVGAMRMQFWRDAVNNSLSYKPRKEPVLVLLSAAQASLVTDTHGKNSLSRQWLHRIINTREKYLHNAPYPTLQALETYAENTYSTLLYLTLSAVPVQSVHADHLASHIGKAQGIAAVLRGLPLIAFPPPPNHHSNQAQFGGSGGGAQAQGAVLLPLDIMAEHGVREHEVIKKGSEASGLRDAVFAVATRANDHLITAREMLKNLKAGQEVGHDFEHQEEPEHQHPPTPTGGLEEVNQSFGIFLQSIATQSWLDKLQKCDFDIFHSSLRTTDWKLPWSAYFAFKRRKI